MGALDRCKTCRAFIRWVETEKGHRACLDADPVPNGNVVLREGRAHFLRKGEETRPDEPRYVVHHATCPNARQHTRPEHVREEDARRRRAGH